MTHGMSSPSLLVERLLATVDAVRTSSSLPIILVGEKSQRAAIIASAAQGFGCNAIALGEELSRKLLANTIAPRQASLSTVISELAGSRPAIFLDRIEILFAPSFRSNPLHVLERISRMKPLIATWPGRMVSGRLRYAEPGHPEYFDADANRVVVFNLTDKECTI